MKYLINKWDKVLSWIKKRYKVILTIVILLVSVPFIFTHCFNLTKISYRTLLFDKNKDKLYLNDTLLWDTGSFGSIIYEEHKEKIPNKIQIGYRLTFDTFYKMKLLKLYYSSQITLENSLSIKNFFFMTVNHPNWNNEIGFIGMDVIGTANWLIDFNSEKVKIFPQNKTIETKDFPQLKLKYKQKRRPKTQLDFLEFQIKGVLIDAGCDDEIALLKSDIEKINKRYKPVDTLTSYRYGIYSTNPTIQYIYIYDTININNICFSTVRIMENNKRLIGFQFFKRFNKVFLNTKEKAFYFY